MELHTLLTPENLKTLLVENADPYVALHTVVDNVNKLSAVEEKFGVEEKYTIWGKLARKMAVIDVILSLISLIAVLLELSKIKATEEKLQALYNSSLAPTDIDFVNSPVIPTSSYCQVALLALTAISAEHSDGSNINYAFKVLAITNAYIKANNIKTVIEI